MTELDAVNLFIMKDNIVRVVPYNVWFVEM